MIVAVRFGGFHIVMLPGWVLILILVREADVEVISHLTESKLRFLG